MGYEPIHRIAQSYLGSLWIAVRAGDEGQNEPALLRRLQLPEDTRAAARQLILQAGREARELHDARVLAVTAVLEEGALVAMVYEHLEAEPLRSLQSWANLRGISFPVAITLRIITDLLRGVHAVHQRFGGGTTPVFGGLSPDSVLVSRDGDTRLADPLIASCASLLEPVGSNTSKLAYAAPEQVHAVAALTPQCDLFSCGAMLWELLATRRFLSGSRAAIERKLLEHNLPSLAANVRGDQRIAPELIAIVERMLASDVSQRPASALAVADQLERAGHELASREEVAQFIGKLSGQRFDRRTAAVRSRSIPNLEAPLELPSELPSRGGARRGSQAKGSQDAALAQARGGQPVPEADLFDSRPEASSGRSGPFTATAAFGTPPLPPRGAAPPAAPAAPAASRSAAATATGPSSPLAGSPPAPPAAAPVPPAPRAVVPPLGPLARPPTPGPAAPIAPAPVRAFPDWAATERGLPPGIGAAPTPRGPLPLTATPSAATPPGIAPVPEPMPPKATPPAATPPALWDTVIAPALSSPSIAATAPTRGRTMTGLGQPVHPALAPSAPFANMTPAPFPLTRPGASPPAHLPQSATPGSETVSSAYGAQLFAPAPASAPRGPSPASSRRDPAPSTLRGAISWASGWIPGRALQRVAWAGLVLLTFGISSVVFVLFLARGQAPRGRAESDFAGAPITAADGAPAPKSEPSPSAPASAAPPESPPSGHEPPASAAAGKPSPANGAPTSTPEPALAPASGSFDTPVLDDEQLVQLFALEKRTELPTCAERLGASAAEYNANNPRQSILQLKAARRELMRGKPHEAHAFLCGAIGHDPGNVAAQQALAELALQLGDPGQAKLAVARGLEREPHNTLLTALLGDAEALLGNLAESRRLWLASLPGKGSEEERSRRLGSSFRVLGDRALRGSGFSQARNYYRRAVILGSGAFAPTIGLSEALLWLGHRRAALAWAERVARAFPKDSRVQLLYGDALYDNEQPDRARAAWQAALDAQPGNVTAARRLARGRR